MIKKFRKHLLKMYNSYLGKINFNFNTKPKRWELINKIIKKNKYTDYLEIGCFDNECFNKINIKNKIGVDPIKGGTVKETSDKFFEKNNKNFDIIFIDGLHIYDQVWRDIQNSLRFLNKGGTILCHDSLPQEYLEQTVPYSIGTWVGDVWKAIVKFRMEKNLDIAVCAIDHGVSIIKLRLNSKPLNLNISSAKNLHYRFYYKNYNYLMNIKNFEDSIKFAEND